MGFEPLPFDPRNSCFCRQNCPSFERPTSRWWLVWSDPPPAIPILGEGVLVEFSNLVVPSQNCIFSAVILPPLVTNLTLQIFPMAPIPGPTIRRVATVFSTLGFSFAALTVDNEECNIPLNLPPVPFISPFGGANMFPVRWFENANDVPH